MTARRSATSSSSTASAPRSARPATGHVRRDPRRRPGRRGASASCCAANPSCRRSAIDEVAIAATTQTGDQGLTIGRTAALLAGLPKTVPGFAIDRMCAGAMTAVTTVAVRHRVRRLRRGDRRRRRAHGPPPDGRGRRPQPAVPRRQAGRPVRAGHGHHRGEPARPVPAADQGARRRVRRSPARRSYAKAYADGKIQPDLVPVATRSAEQRLGPGHGRRAAAPGHHARGAGRR